LKYVKICAENRSFTYLNNFMFFKTTNRRCVWRTCSNYERYCRIWPCSDYQYQKSI